MAVKEMTTFSNLSTEDLGLSSTDTDAHAPQFFMLQKWPSSEPANTRQFHKSSAQAQARDDKRRKLKRSWQRQCAKMEANAKAKAEAQDLNVPTSKAIGAPKAVEGKGEGKILSTGVNDVATSFLRAAGFGPGNDMDKGKGKD